MQATEFDSTAPDPASRDFLTYQQTGDRERLAEALLTCTPELRLELRRLRVPTQDEHDLIQDCFAICIRRSAEFDATRRLQPWLLGVLRNLVQAHRRKLGRAAKIQALPEEVPGRVGVAPEDRLDLDAWRQRVQEILPVMPKQYRAVLHEHLLAGRSTSEIATTLERPPSTVRTQLERGLHELRRRLPAPVLVGLLAVHAAAQAAERPPIAGAPTATGLRPSSLLAAGVAVVALSLGALATWWNASTPEASSDPRPLAAGEVTPILGDTEDPTEAREATAAVPAGTMGEVRLRLAFADGTPAARVATLLEAPTRPGEPLVRSQFRWRPARTDPAGLVVFRGVPPGPAALRLHDLGAVRSFVVTPGEQQLSVAIERLDRITVRVVDAAAAPITEAEVWVAGTLGEKSPGYLAATTDAAGIARVAVFLPRFFVWARAEGRATTDAKGEFRAGGEHDITLQVTQPEARYRVRVVDAEDRPVADAHIAAWSEESLEPPPAYARTAADGTAEVTGLLPGRVRIAVAAGSHGRADAQLPGAAGANTGEVRIVLAPGGAIEGSIDGLRPQDAPNTRLVTQQAGQDAAVNPFAGTGAVPAADGTFRIENLAPGTHDVAVFRLGESAPTSVHRVHVDPTAPAILHVTSGRARPVWKIRIVDDQQQPLPRVWLRTVSPLAWVGPRYDIRARTDEDGYAHLPREGDAPQFVAVHRQQESQPESSGAGPAMQALPIYESKPLTLSDRTIVVPRQQLQTGVVRGQIPASYRNGQQREELSLVTAISGRPIPLAADGSFQAADVPPGSYRLTLTIGELAGRYEQELARFSVAASATVDLGALPDRGAGTLEIHLPATAATHPVMLHVRDAAGRKVALRRTAPGETFAFRLAAGTFSVHYADGDATPRQVDATVLPEKTARVRVERRAGQRCRISVTTSIRPGTAVALLGELRRMGASAPCRITLPQWAEGSGWFRDLDLVPGRYELRAEAPWGQRVTGTFEVRSGETGCEFPFALR